ncbi:MAG: hypothetical protein ACJ0A8_04105 [Dehalococcoidia bacterium]
MPIHFGPIEILIIVGIIGSVLGLGRLTEISEVILKAIRNIKG